MEDVRSMRGADCGTDHHLVMGRFKAKLKITRPTRNTMKRYCTEKLKERETEREYQLAIYNRFEVLNLLEDEEEAKNINSRLGKIIEVIDRSADDTIGTTVRTRRNNWYDEECRRTTEESQNAWGMWVKDKQNENLKQRMREKRRTFRRTRRKKKRQVLDTELSEIEEQILQGNVREHHKKLRQIKKGYQARSNIIKGRNGDVLTNHQDILIEWENYFKTLLNRLEPQNPIMNELDQNDIEDNDEPIPVPTFEEVKEAIKSLKNNKSPGCDGIPAELIKHGGNSLVRELYNLILLIEQEEQMPNMWELADMVTIDKKGSKLECSNYRGISLLCTLYKLFTRILLNRLKPLAEEILGEQQAGFRKGRSTTDQIFTLKIISEKYWEYNKNLYQLFIDFRQAYDSVHRPSMWGILKEFRIPKKLISLIKACYTNSKCSVKVGLNKTNYFNVESGLRQGCMLSPILFNLVLEKAIQTNVQSMEGANINGNKINTLAYADDVVMMSETGEGLEMLSLASIEKCKQFGLECNVGKTKFMLMSRRDRIDGNIDIGKMEIESVESFKYGIFI